MLRNRELMLAGALLALFSLTIPVSNWLILNIGTVCLPDGPCLIPVAPGVLAPSGVLVIGCALVLRDAIHRYFGVSWALVAIAFGSLLSFIFADSGLVVASAAAFLLSESFDLAVYALLARRNLPLAVLVSGLVGAFIDSTVFVWLAFGSLDHVAGQILGKMWASAAAAVVLILMRASRGSGQRHAGP